MGSENATHQAIAFLGPVPATEREKDRRCGRRGPPVVVLVVLGELVLPRDMPQPSVVVWRLFRNASLVGYPRFFVSQTRVFVVLGVLSQYLCCTVEVCVVFLDTLTPVFELYVRLRERRQWDIDFLKLVLLSLVARS
ncbi:hypothetical protein Taro_054860 [Colocasia esculenta]|uniref:Uncharacterized protein n=1 Tax=Colocasia esculenta TaxID=4460 RepID=A0A843XSG3_COLES|nr:hypothetical protein [Colocasia esculenta]